MVFSPVGQRLVSGVLRAWQITGLQNNPGMTFPSGTSITGRLVLV